MYFPESQVKHLIKACSEHEELSLHTISLDFKHTFLTPNTINEDLVVDIRGKTFCTMKIGVVCQFNCLPGSPLGPGSPGDPRFP